MKIAVMQPYFYPYLLYFKLIKTVDTFVFLTDVQYLRRGWMNRNCIRTQTGWQYLTIPVEKSPQDTLIYNIKTVPDWGQLHCKTLLTTYGKKTEQHWLFQKFKELCAETNLCNFLCKSIQHTAANLDIKTIFLDSRDYPSSLRREHRIIDICKKLNATTYVNLPGGTTLYTPEMFAEHNIQLEFIPILDNSNHLSIIDLCLGDNMEKL